MQCKLGGTLEKVMRTSKEGEKKSNIFVNNVSSEISAAAAGVRVKNLFNFRSPTLAALLLGMPLHLSMGAVADMREQRKIYIILQKG